jgi:hypothetical protein
LSSLALSLIVFACVFGGALFGMLLSAVLPKHHLSDESRDVVRQAMGLIGTMAVLLLSLLVASAKSSYDMQKNEVADGASKIVVLDGLLADYGPEAAESRALLRSAVISARDRIWPSEDSQPSRIDPTTNSSETMFLGILGLSPKNDSQRALQSQITSMSIDLRKTRWLMVAQEGSSIPKPLLVGMVVWLTVVFVGFGLFAPRNATVVATMFLCALSVSVAIFLTMEMDRPFSGIIQISDAPVRAALTHLGQ